MTNNPPNRTTTNLPIRSYVRREGRITKSQSRALVELWPEYGLDHVADVLDFEKVYGRDVPTMVEIGFGNGSALVSMAADNPQCNFLGIEVYRPGIGSALLKLKQYGITNVRVIMENAVPVMQEWIGKECLSKILIFFPDPWPKKRHNKRRLLQAPFLNTAVERLKLGGHLHVATDWEDYALSILDLFQREPRLRNLDNGNRFVPRPDYRPQTKYEQRGLGYGHAVWDVIFERTS